MVLDGPVVMRTKRASYYVGLLWLMTVLSPASGCAGAFGPSAQRVSCLTICADNKDQCILAAHEAAQIRRCDAGHFECSEGCPP
jgi:hypothetical protein